MNKEQQSCITVCRTITGGHKEYAHKLYITILNRSCWTPPSSCVSSPYVPLVMHIPNTIRRTTSFSCTGKRSTPCLWGRMCKSHGTRRNDKNWEGDMTMGDQVMNSPRCLICIVSKVYISILFSKRDSRAKTTTSVGATQHALMFLLLHWTF